jgi:hypothetical protein
VTQERMAEWRGVEQENVSCIERHADLLRTTLASSVAAMGGTLRLMAESPNRKPVMVALGDLSASTSVKPRRRSRAPKTHPATSQHPSSSPHPCKPCRGASRICLYRGSGDGPSGEGSTPLSLAMTQWGVTPLFIPGKTLMCLYQRCGRNQRRDSRDIEQVHHGSTKYDRVDRRNVESRHGLHQNHIPSNLVVEQVTAHRKPPDVRIGRLSNQSRVGTFPPSTSTPHWPACWARR